MLSLISVAATTPEVALSTTQLQSTQLQDIELRAEDASYTLAVDPGFEQQAYLKASNPEGADLTGTIADSFGSAVAISGGTVVVGTFEEASSASGINGDQSDNSAPESGAAYVFTRNDMDMTWSQQAYLKASNSEHDDEFGWTVTISGETIVVGAWKEDSNATGTNGDQSNQSAGGAGAAYVFTRSGTVWSQQDYLKASNTDPADEFGFSTAISGGTVVVGALREDSNATGVDGDESNVLSFFDAGAAYVFVDPSISSETDTNINAGHAGAWYNPATSGQGQLIDIEPATQFMFLAWFTFTDAASGNPNEQQWYTAQGNYSGNTAVLDLFETLGGKFDDPEEVTTTPIGEVTLSFSDCNQGQMTYSMDGKGLHGEFPLSRAIPGSGNVCEGLSETATQAVDINSGMDGAWYDPITPGQGFLIDAHPNPAGGNFIFVAWFTYGQDTASGQRWLTTQGSFEGSTAEMDVYESTGGSFDDPQAPGTTKVGTMNVDFTDCSNALLSYSLPADPAEGDIAITGVIPGGRALCEELAAAK